MASGAASEAAAPLETTPLPKVDEEEVGRVTLDLGAGMALVLDAPVFPEDMSKPKARLYLTQEGGVVESREDAAALFAFGPDAQCEEIIAEGGTLELGGGKVARLVLGCVMGEDVRATAEAVVLLEVPGGAITSLGQLTPRWKGTGGEIVSMFWAQCVTHLTASYALEGGELVVTRAGKATYEPENPAEPDVAEEDCVAPEGSVERAPWKKAL